MTAKTAASGTQVILYDDALLDHADAALFTRPTSAASAPSVVGGRGSAWILERGGGEQWVLRHYRRGGVPGKLVRDDYFWIGLDLSSPWREWRLLDSLYKEGLPVPRPVAARVERRGFFYRGDLITRRIPDARNLAERLAAGEAARIPWSQIGRCIRRFHEAGVRHADLNAHNVLLDAADTVYLIDFDRGTRREAGAWTSANLARLKRSLDKLSGPDGFNLAAWSALLEGYGRLG
jgi:3-deoxy-D-manno-octulosonic acid kinase